MKGLFHVHKQTKVQKQKRSDNTFIERVTTTSGQSPATKAVISSHVGLTILPSEFLPLRMVTSKSYKKGSSKDHRCAWGTTRGKAWPTKPVVEPTLCPSVLAFTTTCKQNTAHPIIHETDGFPSRPGMYEALSSSPVLEMSTTASRTLFSLSFTKHVASP